MDDMVLLVLIMCLALPLGFQLRRGLRTGDFESPKGDAHVFRSKNPKTFKLSVFLSAMAIAMLIAFAGIVLADLTGLRPV